ncbi:MAG: VacB/RNase II family 3'-5' exoribonuclease, partial [Mariprofundaceae bacterium]
SRPLRGRVVDVLGQDLTPTRLIDLVVAELGLPHEFPALADAEAARYPDEVTEADSKGRKDLTGLPFVTIDGADARDFDDAICILPRGEGFEAWVAIADVAHYVHPNSALDKEALERSNSFYFPDRVIPMLPEKLSNGLCSLNPHVPRLAMAVRMRFDANGKRHAIHPYEAVIHSHARLTYEQASEWLDDRNEAAIEDAAVRSMLDDAARLFRKLQTRREQRGALDLDVPEVRAVLHEGRVTDMSSSDRNTAHHLIEEMMLAANTAIAEYFDAKHSALLYRVHPAPENESIESLNEFLAPFGLSVRLPGGKAKEDRVRPGDVQRVLEQSEGKPFSHVLHRLVLRSMQQARYTPENEGHFGLAYSSYAHFTSPIRRYADLTVHRRLKALIRGENPDKVQPAKTLASIGEQTSIQERKQQRGEWDTQAMLAALFHQKDVGKTLTARISGLTKRRIFFELEETLAEAALDVDALSGLFDLDDRNHRLVARQGGNAYALGDALSVRIDGTDPVRGQINVSLVDGEKEKSELESAAEGD